MQEHFSMTLIYSLLGTPGENREYRGVRLLGNVARYYLFHRGPLSRSLASVGGFARTGVEGNRPDVQFTLAPNGPATDVATDVTWAMEGRQPFMAKVFSTIVNCDRMVGGQFEEGLAKLKGLAEG